jgi:hypothetical protein
VVSGDTAPYFLFVFNGAQTGAGSLSFFVYFQERIRR